MKKIIALIPALAVLSACALLSPYSITFTTPDDSVVNPEYNTLDFAVSAPTLAYISGVQCDEEEAMELLPVITDDMQVSNAHNLTLEVLANQSPGSKCEVTVTAFDQTTTSNSRKSISLYVLEVPDVLEMPDETADTAPPVAGLGETCSGPEHISCEDGLICKRAPEDNAPEAEGICEIPVVEGETCDDGTGCPAGETTVNTDETTDTTSEDSSTEESGA